jgi:hypothetical protein
MSINETIKVINEVFQQRKQLYKGIIIRAAFAKENGVWKNIIMIVMPTNDLTKDEKELDYGDIVIIKTYVSLDRFHILLSELETNQTIKLANYAIKLDSDTTNLPLFSYPWGENFVSSLGSGDIERLGVKWPSKSFILGQMQLEAIPSFPVFKWVQKGLPVYENAPNAIENELGIAGVSHEYHWFGKVVFIMPDFRARFTKITIRSSSIVAHIEVSPEFKENLLVKYMNLFPFGEEHPSFEVHLKGDSVTIELDHRPSIFYCFLITEAFEVIDVIRYDENYGYFFRDWIEYDEARDRIEYLISQGESQTLEYRRDLGDYDRFFKAVVAFSNTNDGVIMLGVLDDGSIVGSGNIKKDQIEQSIRDKIMPFAKTEIEMAKHNDKPIIIVRVKEGTEKPYYLKSGNSLTPYVRRNASNVAMRYDEIEDIYRQKFANGNDIRFG